MKILARRLAGLAVVGVTVASAAVAGATAAAAGPTPPTGTKFLNTATAQKVVLADSLPSVTYTAGATVQLVGPGSAKTTITGTGTKVVGAGTCISTLCTASSITTTLDFVTAGLPAGPGSYVLSVYPGASGMAGTSNSLDETTVTVTGAAPKPTGTTSPVAIKPGASGGIKLVGSDFAAGDTVTSTNAGIVFTAATPQGTATQLDGSIAVGASVPVGSYNLTVTDTAGQTGVCTGCLEVQSLSVINPTLTSVAPTAFTAGDTSAITLTGTGFASGMTVTLSDTTSTSAPIAATVTSATSATFAPPAALFGGTYDVTVTNTDTGTATLPAALTVAPSPDPTSLTLVASKSALAHGKSVTLRGVLTRNTPTGLQVASGETVRLYDKPAATGKTSLLTTVTTNSSGAYSKTISPKTNATYVAYYAGTAPSASSAGDQAAFSSTAPTVTVAAEVIAEVDVEDTLDTAPLVVTGRVSPSDPGKLVHLVSVSATGQVLSHLGTATLTSTSHFRFHTHKPSKPGKYLLEVTVGSHLSNTGATSKPFKIQRTK